MKPNIITKPLSTFVMIVGILFIDTTGSQAVEIRGADDKPDILMRWHRVSFTFDGPATSETANPNLYFNYRLYVTFSVPRSSAFPLFISV